MMQETPRQNRPLTNPKSGRNDTVLLLEKYGAARSFGGPPLRSKALGFNDMIKDRAGLIVLVFGGIVSGPAMLMAAHAARPPLDWGSVALCFFGLLIGLPYVIGIQLFNSDPKYAVQMLSFFSPTSVFITASGLSALIYGTYRDGFSPTCLFFFAGGVAMLIAVGICSVLCDIKVKRHNYQRRMNPNNSQERTE
jgi:hypothetical protein